MKELENKSISFLIEKRETICIKYKYLIINIITICEIKIQY